MIRKKINLFYIGVMILILLLVSYFIGFLSAKNIDSSEIEVIQKKSEHNNFFEFYYPKTKVNFLDSKMEKLGVVDASNLDFYFNSILNKKSYSRIWESTSESTWKIRSEPLTSGNWYIIGSLDKKRDSQVFVEVYGHQLPVIYKIGDHLPDGSILDSVSKDRIKVITSEGDTLSLSIN